MGCGQNCIKQSSMKETKTQYLESLQHENTTQVHAISIQSQPLIQYQLILQETKPPKKPAIHSQDNSDIDINFENNEFNIEHFSAIRCLGTDFQNYYEAFEQQLLVILQLKETKTSQKQERLILIINQEFNSQHLQQQFWTFTISTFVKLILYLESNPMILSLFLFWHQPLNIIVSFIQYLYAILCIQLTVIIFPINKFIYIFMGGIQCQENKKSLTTANKNQSSEASKAETPASKLKQPTCCYAITWQDTKPPQKIGNAYSPFDTEETEDICCVNDSDKDQSIIKAQSISYSENSSTTIKNILKNLNIASPNHSSLGNTSNLEGIEKQLWTNQKPYFDF
ncbi:hypothetical protein pb186bvf_011575 [Paramecium bursaria]